MINSKHFTDFEALIYATYHDLDIKVLKKNESYIIQDINKSNSAFFIFMDDDVPEGYEIEIMKMSKLIKIVEDYRDKDKETDSHFAITYFYICDWPYNIDAFSAFTKEELDKFIAKQSNIEPDILKQYEFLNW